MKHGSLFSGIGGFDLASEWMGWDNEFHCEWEDFPRKILKHYWPEAVSYGDIKETDFTIWRNKIDILTGGFPCQPYSSAGKRLGKEDDRHLWPEMLRAIREIKPRWIVGENVRGLVNWSEGLVFEEVCAELEAEGYKVQPFLLPACGVGAPHRRDRIWFVAFKDSNENGWGSVEWKEKSQERRFRNPSTRSNEQISSNNEQTRITAYSDGAVKGNGQRKDTQEKREVWRDEKSDVPRELSSDGNATDSDNSRTDKQMRDNGNGKEENKRWKGQSQPKFGKVGNNATDTASTRGWEDNGERKSRFNDQKSPPNDWQNFPTQSPICGGDDGLPSELDRITFPKWKKESIKGYGNAIVPQVVYQIFKSIQEYENLLSINCKKL